MSTRRSLSDLEADGALTFLGRNSDGTPVYGADGAIDGTQVTEVVQELLDDGQTVLVLTGTHGSRDGTLTPERQFTAQDLESFREVGNGRVEVVDVFDAGARSGDPSANVTSALAGRFSDATQDAIVLAFCNSEFCIDAISGAGITRE